MKRHWLKLLLSLLLFLTACSKKQLTDLQVISHDVWKGRTTKDSVLSIGKYIETPNYIHYWVVVHKRPYSISPALANTLEEVDDQTIFTHKVQQASNDYKRLLRKGIIKLSDHAGGNEFAGHIYIFKKGKEHHFKVASVPQFFEALHQQDVQHEPWNDAEQQRNYEAATSLLFEE